jgi:hypothetical protein
MSLSILQCTIIAGTNFQPAPPLPTEEDKNKISSSAYSQTGIFLVQAYDTVSTEQRGAAFLMPTTIEELSETGCNMYSRCYGKSG